MSLPNQSDTSNMSNAGPPGIIDTLGNGFALLNRRPYLVWLPVLLDLLIWSGFRVSLVQPLSWIGSELGNSTGVIAETAASVRDALSGTELVQLMGALMPTLINSLGSARVPGLHLLTEFVVSGSTGSVLLIAGALATVLIGVSYLTMIARLVVDRPAWGFQFMLDCVGNSVRLAGVVLAIAGFLSLLFAPFAVLGAGMNLVGVDMSVALVVIGFLMAFWAFVFFFFSAHAITVSRASAAEAMRASYAMVYQHLFSVLALLLIVLVIRVGTPMALRVFTETQWSVPFAIVVNAYIATGLIAATMLYFRDRSRDSNMTPATAGAAGSRS